MSSRVFPFRRRQFKQLGDTPDPVEQLTQMDEGVSADNPLPTSVRGIHNFTHPRGIPNWENIDQMNYIPLPAIGAEATILQYIVPPGRNGIIFKVACNFVGGGWIEGSGLVLWRLLVDGTPPPGANSYDSIPGSLGSPANPVEIAGFRIFENQKLQFNVANVAPGVVVAQQFCGARFVGWNYPVEFEEDNIWI